MLTYQSNLKQYSRSLRMNMTDVEIRLWSKLRRKQLKGFQFYRQKPIGPYIVDFYCPTQDLVIELDGGQHYEDSGRQSDRRRDDYLKRLGLSVLRYSNRDVIENLTGVLETILQNLPSPLFAKEGDKAKGISC